MAFIFITKGKTNWKYILIIVILALIVAGESFLLLKQRINIPENKLPEKVTQDETADWKTYRNEGYGYEVKYPTKIEEDQINYYDRAVTFSYFYPSREEPIIYNTLRVEVADNPSQLPVKTWVYENEKCGIDPDSYKNVDLAGVGGIRIKGLGACPPGAAGIGHKVYLSKNSKIYMIEVIKEIISKETQECLKEQENTFNQMLSTFTFIEEEKALTKEEACINSGGTVSISLCCKHIGDFPNLCLIGACGCPPEYSHEVKICSCGTNRCFNGNECVDRRYY